jgi:hypothetical protein
MTAASSLSSFGKKSNSVKKSKFKIATSDFKITKSDFVRSQESICAPKKLKLELLKLSSAKNSEKPLKKTRPNSSTDSLSRISTIKEDTTTTLKEKKLINLKTESDLSKSEFVQPL